jgi:hypothetical protein
MRTTCRSEPDLTTAQKVFNTTAVTVAGLYVATHSFPVTFIGTTAASLLTGWMTWLSHRRNRMRATATAPPRPNDDQLFPR